MHATNRRQNNRIQRFVIDLNEILEKEEDIPNAFHNYFTNLFSTSSPTIDDREQCTQAMEPKATKKMNVGLIKRYTREEVSEALK